MKNITFLITAILCFNLSTKAQNTENTNLNDYKYIIVPIQYDFLKEDNEFLLTSLTKHLFTQEGYIVLIDDEELPKDLIWNPCLALKVQLEGKYKDMFSFKTDLKLKLLDCKKNVVFESIGSSRNKKYKEAYQEALREAFYSLKSIDYSYKPKDKEQKQQPGKFEQIKKEKKLFTTPTIYSYKENRYTLTAIEAGYLLISEGETNKAFINQTSNGDILYNSQDMNGTLSILDNGDFQVEYFNKLTGKVEKAVFKKQD